METIEDNKVQSVDKKRKGVIKLPWNGKIELDRCKSLVWGGGLHLQCEGEGERYCVSCDKRINSDGLNKMGDVYERAQKAIGDYKDGYGRRSVSYAKYMLKNGISREEVDEAAREQGVVLCLEHFEEKTERRGRPRKEEKEVVELEESEKKRRGRPRKEKEVSSNVRGEELIASLMESELEGESETEIDVRRIKINGKEYLISEEGVLYDKESHEEVGRWNASRGMIEE